MQILFGIGHLGPEFSRKSYQQLIGIIKIPSLAEQNGTRSNVLRDLRRRLTGAAIRH